jgi:hypothetical protein
MGQLESLRELSIAQPAYIIIIIIIIIIINIYALVVLSNGEFNEF